MWGDRHEVMEMAAEAKAAREQDEVNAAAYEREQNGLTIAYYNFSSEEWDALPVNVQYKLRIKMSK